MIEKPLASTPIKPCEDVFDSGQHSFLIHGVCFFVSR